MYKIIAKTKHITIEKRWNYYVVICNSNQGYNKFFSREKAFAFARDMIRYFNS